MISSYFVTIVSDNQRNDLIITVIWLRHNLCGVNVCMLLIFSQFMSRWQKMFVQFVIVHIESLWNKCFRLFGCTLALKLDVLPNRIHKYVIKCQDSNTTHSFWARVQWYGLQMSKNGCWHGVTDVIGNISFFTHKHISLLCKYAVFIFTEA